MRSLLDYAHVLALILGSSSRRTPIVNDEFLQHVREGKVTYKRGDTKRVVRQGIQFVERERGTKSGDNGDETLISADVCGARRSSRRGLSRLTRCALAG